MAATKAVPKKAVKSAVVKKPTVNKTPLWGFKVDISNEEEAEVSLTKDGQHYRAYDVRMGSVQCSCGVTDFDGVSSFVQIYTDLRGVPNRDTLVKAIISTLVEEIKDADDSKAAFVIMSNRYENRVNSTNDIINGFLDELCIACSDVRVNPNSRSHIRLWTM